jgi:hypothetical protein
MVKYWAKAGEMNRMRLRLRLRETDRANQKSFRLFFIDLPYGLLPSAMHHAGCMAALNLTWFRANSAID